MAPRRKHEVMVRITFDSYITAKEAKRQVDAIIRDGLAFPQYLYTKEEIVKYECFEGRRVIQAEVRQGIERHILNQNKRVNNNNDH